MTRTETKTEITKRTKWPLNHTQNGHSGILRIRQEKKKNKDKEAGEQF